MRSDQIREDRYAQSLQISELDKSLWVCQEMWYDPQIGHFGKGYSGGPNCPDAEQTLADQRMAEALCRPRLPQQAALADLASPVSFLPGRAVTLPGTRKPCAETTTPCSRQRVAPGCSNQSHRLQCLHFNPKSPRFPGRLIEFDILTF